jgi:biopolymer transport protein ExbD
MASKHRTTFNEINITPLTDIFLVLLIIMMVIAPMLDQQGLKLLVPGQQEETQSKQDSKIIDVQVSDNNEYTIDGKAVNADALIFKIQEEFVNKKDGLLIKASGNSTHQAVVKVMDAARNVGITSISLDEQ